MLVTGPVLYVLFDRRNLAGSMRGILHWSREDWTWLRTAPRFFWARDRCAVPPAQGKYDAGQKLNTLVQMVCFAIFVATGAVMWFWSAAVPPAGFRAATARATT